MKYPSAAFCGLLSLALLAMAEAPPTPVQTLPTSPAEVAELLKRADAAEAWRKELVARRLQTRNHAGQAIGQLRNGAFKTSGGIEQPDYKRLSAAIAELDAQGRAKRDAMAAAEKAGDKDERAACEIEAQRLRARKDALQTQFDTFIVQWCLVQPAAKAQAEQVLEVQRKAAEAEKQLKDYDEQLETWRGLVDGYRNRQKPAGLELPKVQELTLPPPPDAEQRRAEFARRDNPAGIEALAHRLFRSLDEKSPGLDKPFTLYRQKQFAAALDAFKDYFFDKLANLEKYSVPPQAIITDERPPLGTPVLQQQWVEDAMRGVATQPNRNVSRDALLRIQVGEPGAVNWAHVPWQPQTQQKMPVWLQIMRQFHLLERDGGDAADGLRCWLIDAAQVTGDGKYLLRWAQYADDWALNMQRDLNALQVEEIPPGYDPVAIRQDGRQAPYRWNVRWYPTLISRQMPMFVTRLRAMVMQHPQVMRQFPSATLARVLVTGLDEYLAPNILVARATRFNWNMMGLGFSVRCGLLLGEFKAAQWAGREAARAFQNHATFSIMPDGGYVEYSDEGHQGVWMERASTALQLWQLRKPANCDPGLQDDIKESLTRNGEFFLRHLKPDGYRHRDDYRSARGVYVGRRIWPFGPGSLDAAIPWLTDQPEPQRILTTVFGNAQAGKPEHVSDVMPCLGEFMLRGGWGPDDPFFYMHSGRIPNSNPDEDCNGFKLHNFGRHLLTGQPIYVDGRTQNQHYKHVDNVGAKTAFLTYSDGQPIPGRWHTSSQFDFAEGVYEGAYEDRAGRTYWSTFHTGGYDLRRQQRGLGMPAVTEVQRHTRQVFFIRQPVAWIVVDRIRTSAKHEYEVPFELYTPVDKVDWYRRAKTPIPKADSRVMLAEKAQSIRTDNPGFPGVMMHCFASSQLRLEFDPKSHDLAHKDTGEIRAAENEWKSNRPELRDLMAFVRRALVKWSGEGDQLLVTFITSAPGDADPASQGWQVKGNGSSFQATAPDGSTIVFAAASNPEPLKADRVTAVVDTLLLVKPRNAEAHGIVLGARTLSCGNQQMNLAADGVEFSLKDQPSITREIYSPIKPVTFGPGTNIFVDHIDVTMESATPGMEIRYTLDGSESQARPCMAVCPGPAICPSRQQRHAPGSKDRRCRRPVRHLHARRWQRLPGALRRVDRCLRQRCVHLLRTSRTGHPRLRSRL